MRAAKTLIRLGGCPGWSESSLGAHVILLVLPCGGSNELANRHKSLQACEDFTVNLGDQNAVSVIWCQFRCNQGVHQGATVSLLLFIVLLDLAYRSLFSFCYLAYFLILKPLNFVFISWLSSASFIKYQRVKWNAAMVSFMNSNEIHLIKSTSTKSTKVSVTTESDASFNIKWLDL